MEAVASKRRLAGRKRIKITTVEKALSANRVIQDSTQWSWFAGRYIEKNAPMHRRDAGPLEVPQNNNHGFVERACSALRSIPNKSMAWKFQMLVDLGENIFSKSNKASQLVSTLEDLAKKAKAGLYVMERGFASPLNLSQYDGTSKRYVDTRNGGRF